MRRMVRMLSFVLAGFMAFSAMGAGVSPVADAGSDIRISDTDGDGASFVNLDGSGSSDSDGVIVSYEWSAGGSVIGSDEMVTTELAVGSHIVTLTVTDDEGLNDSDTVEVVVTEQPAVVQLNLSSGYTMDTVVGPKEFQQCLIEGVNIWGVLGGANNGMTGSVVDSSRHILVASDGDDVAYSISGSPGHPNNMGSSQALPSDGVIVGDDRIYHLPSIDGNATLPGDWTEVADPATHMTKANAMVIRSDHNINTFQIAAATAELSSEQKGQYGDINFVLTAMKYADKARNMRIVALYGESGEDEQVLYSFSTEDGGSGPLMLDATPEAGFIVVKSMTKVLDSAAGTTGSLRDQGSRLYEFEFPIALDASKNLWGIRIEDTVPGMNWNARGLVVFAATAKVPSDGLAPPVAYASNDVTVTDVDNDGSEGVVLSAENSTDDQGIVSYEWSVDGSVIGTGMQPTVMLAAGEHEVVLTVTDTDGLIDKDTVDVTVLYGGVVADAGPDRNVAVANAGDSATVTLDGSRSSTPMGVITSYVWREGGSQIATGETSEVVFTYGSHTVELEVINDLGWSDIDTITINLMTAPALKGNTFTNYKSGISLEPKGVEAVDWVFERWYHDPLVDDHGVIYINSGALLELYHNEMNRCANESDPLIGKDGLDGVPNSGDEGLIRMKADMDWSWRYRWTYMSVENDVEPEYLVPEYDGPFAFADLQYYDGTPVVGSVGPNVPLTPYPAARSTDFYFRGLTDAFGDEWHIITVGDDDFMLYSTWYEAWSSDGKIFYFVVDPKTPAISFSKESADAQWYTTPIKAYFVPKLHDQTTFVSAGVAVAFHNVTNGETVKYRIDEIHGSGWLTFADAVVSLDGFGLQVDTVYTLRYKIGDDGVEKTRVIHYQPGYPSDAEPHPSVVLFKDASMEQRIRDLIATNPYYAGRFDNLHDPFSSGHGPYARPTMEGKRWVEERGANLALNNAFCVYIDGLGVSPLQEQLARDFMLDNCMNLDPIGTEISHLTSVPCRERVGWGYYHVRSPISVALAYDLLIKDFRYPQYANGFTAIEDLKIRDYIGAFATETLRLYEYGFSGEWPNRGTTTVSRSGMWTTAREMGIALCSMAIPSYDTPYYGTSGGDGRSATHAWTPYPDTPTTWFDATMSREANAGIYGVLREGDPVKWLDREGYWEGTGLMGQLYYKLANARYHWDGHRWDFFEEAFDLSMQGILQSSKVQGGDDGWAYKTTGMIVNEFFPALAAPMEAILAAGTGSNGEENFGSTLWAQGVFALCYMRLDWRDHLSDGVAGRYVFYNDSSFDGNDAAANVNDDAAIATDKSVLLPGITATSANYTSYVKGINGIMVDLDNTAGAIDASDFEFAIGEPGGWVAAPAPTSVTARAGAGADGSDRVTITWANGAISETWLRVTVKANADTGLTADDVFYIGNAVGDTCNSASDTIVDATDEIGCRNNPRTFMRPAGIESVYDFNRDGKVDATDQIIARNNVTDFSSALPLIVGE